MNADQDSKQGKFDPLWWHNLQQSIVCLPDRPSKIARQVLSRDSASPARLVKRAYMLLKLACRYWNYTIVI